MNSHYALEHLAEELGRVAYRLESRAMGTIIDIADTIYEGKSPLAGLTRMAMKQLPGSKKVVLYYHGFKAIERTT